MAIVQITELDDERLAPFRDIRTRSWTHASGRFIAEGPLLVDRLLASDYDVQSLLIDERRVDQYVHIAARALDLLVVRSSQIERITGFDFHRGVMGCGIRKPLRELRAELPSQIAADEVWVGAFGIEDSENLGVIMRTSSALGVRCVVIGHGTCDPFSRRALRVAMGTTLRMELLESRDSIGDLLWLKQQGRVECIAASLDEDAVDLQTVRKRSGSCLILFGNEKKGLPREVQDVADSKLKISMSDGVDSLNVGVATGIMIYHFTRQIC